MGDTDKRILITVEGRDLASAPLRGIGAALGDVGKIAIGGALASGIVGITNSIGGMAREAFGAVASQELLTKSLGTMLTREVTASAQASGANITLAKAREVAAQKAQELVSWTETLGAESPFSGDDVAKSFQMAMSYGFSSDKAKQLTEDTINLASAYGLSGQSMERINLALGQIRGKGRLMGGELMQLTEARVPMREMLIESGKVSGLTMQNFDKMMEAGKISSDAVTEAYDGFVKKNFATAAKDQAESLSGLTNTLGDLKVKAERLVFGPIFKAAQPYIAEFTRTLSDPAIQAQIGALGAKLGELASGALQTFGNVLKTVGGIFADVYDRIMQDDAWGAISNLVYGVATALGVGGDSASAFADGVATGVMDAFSGIQQAINNYIVPAVGVFVGLFQQAVGWVQANWPQIQAVVGDVLNAIGYAVNTYIVPSVQFLISQFQQIVGWVQANWPLISATVSAVGQAIQNVINTVAPIVSKVLGGAFESAKAAISTAIALIEGILKTAMQIITGDWEGAWDTLKTTAENVWKGIQEFFNGLPKTMAQFGADLMNAFIGAVSSFRDKVLEAIKGIIVNAFNAVKAALGIPVDITPQINVNSAQVAAQAARAANSIKSAFSGAFDAALSLAQPELGGLRLAGGGYGQNLPAYASSSAPGLAGRPAEASRVSVININIDDQPIKRLVIDWVKERVEEDMLRY